MGMHGTKILETMRVRERFTRWEFEKITKKRDTMGERERRREMGERERERVKAVNEEVGSGCLGF